MKKLLGIVLVCAILGALCVPAAAAFEDTVGKTCETAVEVLTALGIVEGRETNVFAPEASLTRAEMTAIMLRTLNMVNAGGEDIYSDVNASHWAYADIAAASRIGIIDGIGDGMFSPDANVTYEQAVKMTVCILGYKVKAEAMGGFPAGYLAQAAQLGILKGVQATSDMSRGNMAVLVYNALDKDIFERVVWGGNEYVYTDQGGKTLLSAYLKIEKMTDVIAAVPWANTGSGNVHLRKDEAMLAAGTVIKCSAAVQDMVGLCADVYAREENGILYAAAVIPTTVNEEIIVSGPDVSTVTDVGEFVYTDAEGRERRKSLSGAIFLYNGALEPISAALLKPSVGSVRIVENGRNMLVFAEHYNNIIVDRVNVETNTVYYKQIQEDTSMGIYKEKTGSIVIDFSDTGVYTVIYDKMGNALTLNDIKQYDAISIMESKDNTVRKMYLSYDKVTGKIEEISKDANEVKIEGVEYPVDSVLMKAEPSVFKIGDRAEFYLDSRGNIAGTGALGEQKEYGWLVNAANAKGLDSIPQFKIFTGEGEMQTFDVAPYAVINNAQFASMEVAKLLTGEKTLSDGHEPLFGYKSGFMDKAGVIPQLVRYEVNTAGNLTKLETAVNLTANGITDEEKQQEDFSMDFYVGPVAKQAQFNYTNKGVGYGGTTEYTDVLFGRVRKADAKTVLFDIPSDLSREDLYRVTTPDKRIGLEYYRYNMTNLAVYDVDTDFMAAAMVLHNYLGGQASADKAEYMEGQHTPVALIEDVCIGINANDETVTKLSLYNWNGQAIEATLEDTLPIGYYVANADYKSDPAWRWGDGTDRTANPNKNRRVVNVANTPSSEMILPASALEAGDIIQYRIDGNGALEAVSVIYRASYPGGMELSHDNGILRVTTVEREYVGGLRVSNGTVCDVTKYGPTTKVYLMDTNGNRSTTEAVRSLQADAQYVIYDKKAGTIKKITSSDVTEGDAIVALYSTTTMKMGIVFRNSGI